MADNQEKALQQIRREAAQRQQRRNAAKKN
jgi:hypothetical protein